MKIVNYSYARKNFRKVLDEVVNDSEVTCVVSKGNQVVIMSKSDYDSMVETLYVTRSFQGGLTGMSDGKDEERYQAQFLGGGDTVK